MKYIKLYNDINESIYNKFKYNKDTLEDFFVELLDEGWMITSFQQMYFNSSPGDFDNSKTIFNNCIHGYYVEIRFDHGDDTDDNFYSADSIRKYSSKMVEIYKSIASVSNKLERMIGEIRVSIDGDHRVSFHIKEKNVLSFTDEEASMDRFVLLVTDLLNYTLDESEYKLDIDSSNKIVEISFTDKSLENGVLVDDPISRGSFTSVKGRFDKLATGRRKFGSHWIGEFCYLTGFRYTLEASYSKKKMILKMSGLRQPEQ